MIPHVAFNFRQTKNKLFSLRYNYCTKSFKGGGCLLLLEVVSMVPWNNLQKGFAASECLLDAIIDISSTNVFSNVARIYRQTLKKAAPL